MHTGLPLPLADAILLVTLIVIAPAYSYYAGSKVVRGEVLDLRFVYVRTMLSWWLITLAMLFIWRHFERPLSALGLVVPYDARSLAAAAFYFVVAAMLALQVLIVQRLTAERLDEVRARFGKAAAILPRTRGELVLFLGVATTAGICEELLFRGYFFAVTSPFITLVGALLVSTLVFGSGHAYQGLRGVARTAVAGFVMGLLYIASGSILWPILLHATLNIHGGLVGYRILRGDRVHPTSGPDR